MLIPGTSDEPVQVVSDTRAASRSLSFDQLFARGHFPEAAIVAERDLQAAREQSVPGGQSLLAALSQVAAACLRIGDSDRAESVLNEAIEICETAPAERAESLVRLLHDRAYVKYLYCCTDEESALEVRQELGQVRARAEKLLGSEHVETARIMTTQASLLISEFAYQEAEELLTASIRIRTRAFGPEHRDISDSLLQMARVHAYRDDDEDADSAFRQALAIREAACGPNHPDVAEVLFHYADFLVYNRSNGSQAELCLRRALEIWNETIGLDHPLVARETAFIRKVLSGTAVDAADLDN